jgi:hypothetical protein
MKRLLETTTLVVVVLFLVYNFLPLWILDAVNISRRNFGSTITTIQGSDTLKDSRAVINANFSNLNSDKVEETDANTWTALNQFANASTTLFSAYGPAYFGATATSSFSTAGALTLVTPLLVPSGGTGAATLTQHAVLLGNGTGALATVSGLGTSGQSLVSNGAGSAPTWQSPSFDTAANYTLTGHWIFSSLSASRASTTHATTTGSQYFTNILSSLLKTDSTGKLSAATPGVDYTQQKYTFATTSDTTVSSGYATSSPFNIPAGVASASSTIQVTANTTAVDSGTDGQCTLVIRDTTGTNLVTEITLGAPTTDDTIQTNYSAIVHFNSSVSSQTSLVQVVGVNTQNAAENLSTHGDNAATINFTNATSLVGVIRSTASGVACTLETLSFVLHP